MSTNIIKLVDIDIFSFFFYFRNKDAPLQRRFHHALPYYPSSDQLIRGSIFLKKVG